MNESASLGKSITRNFKTKIQAARRRFLNRKRKHKKLKQGLSERSVKL
ncbi:hypothetical protein LCGC14_1378990 [marine sediment metagenome]|uniref:Uncharacterized protein n=1 Tax=marine sediment metagenome TaxID=412755 RepID=A0A0F9MIK9_9ZZZZ